MLDEHSNKENKKLGKMHFSGLFLTGMCLNLLYASFRAGGEIRTPVPFLGYITSVLLLTTQPHRLIFFILTVRKVNYSFQQAATYCPDFISPDELTTALPRDEF